MRNEALPQEMRSASSGLVSLGYSLQLTLSYGSVLYDADGM